ncbi:hypothetical protein BJX62DRAFT_243098 [Aspergillus germanicus]
MYTPFGEPLELTLEHGPIRTLTQHPPAQQPPRAKEQSEPPIPASVIPPNPKKLTGKLLTASCGCEAFPVFPDALVLTIVIWPVEQQLDHHQQQQEASANDKVQINVYPYVITPEARGPRALHKQTGERSDLPLLERIGTFDMGQAADFMAAAGQALQSLTRLFKAAEKWNDDPLSFRDMFIDGMERAGWVN